MAIWWDRDRGLLSIFSPLRLQPQPVPAQLCSVESLFVPNPKLQKKQLNVPEQERWKSGKATFFLQII